GSSATRRSRPAATCPDSTTRVTINFTGCDGCSRTDPLALRSVPRSMTGFGSAEGSVLGGRLSIEIRSVNHRYFNPQLKLPFELAGTETQLREHLRRLLERGHVTLSARWSEPPATESAVTVDLARARQVLAAARELKKQLKLKGEVDLAFVARHPDVLALERDGAAAEWSEVEPIVE